MRGYRAIEAIGLVRVVLRLSAILTAATLAACESLPSEIKVTDRSVFVPSARVSVDLSPREETPSGPHSGHAIEVGVSGGRGSDTQTLGNGDQPVVLGGQTFNAPDQLRHEFDFRFYELAYRYRKFFGRNQRFGIEGLGGLAYADLGLTVSSTTQRASERLGHGGLVGGFGGLWRFRPTTSLQSRLTLFISGGSGGVETASRFDLYVAQALGRHAALRAGFSAWQLEGSAREGDNARRIAASDFKVKFSGPTLGLDVMF